MIIPTCQDVQFLILKKVSLKKTLKPSYEGLEDGENEKEGNHKELCFLLKQFLAMFKTHVHVLNPMDN